MNNYLSEYKKIIKKFVNREMSAKCFDRAFNNLFNNDEKMKTLSSKEFDFIDDLWGWVELYEPKKHIRSGNVDYLDEKQLRNKVREFQDKINMLFGEERTSIIKQGKKEKRTTNELKWVKKLKTFFKR